MSFDYNDLLLEADDEAKKEDEEKKEEEKKEDEKKSDDDKKDDSESKDDDEYNDLIDDEPSDDTDFDSETDDSSDTDDEYNDLIDDDLSTDGEDDITTDSSTSDDGGDDYNALIMVKTDGNSDGSNSVYEKLAKLGYVYTVIANNMKHIHLNTCGRKFEEIHRQAENYYNHFNYGADHMFEVAAESPFVKLDNPTRAKEHVEDIEVETDDKYPFEKALSVMSNNLNKAIEYAKEVRIAAGDARSDVQSFLDDQLVYLNKEANYFIRKKLMSEDIPSATTDTIEPAMESYNWLI